MYGAVRLLTATECLTLLAQVRVTYRPSRVREYYQHLLGKWGEQNVFSLMNTVEPEFHRFDSYEVTNP
jgi:hypothetical protein